MSSNFVGLSPPALATAIRMRANRIMPRRKYGKPYEARIHSSDCKSGRLQPGALDVGVAGQSESKHLALTEREVESGDIFGKLFDPAAGNDRKDSGRALAHPGDEHLVGAALHLGRNGFEDAQTFVGIWAGKLRRQFAIGSRVGPLQQHGITDQGNALKLRESLQLFVQKYLRTKIGAVARSKIGIALLDHGIRIPTVGPGYGVCLGDTPDREIAGTNRPDFPIAN